MEGLALQETVLITRNSPTEGCHRLQLSVTRYSTNDIVIEYRSPNSELGWKTMSEMSLDSEAAKALIEALIKVIPC